MDGQDAFGLEHPQRVPQRRDGNADEIGELALRHEGAGRDAAVEQAFQDPVIGEVAQAPRGDRLASVRSMLLPVMPLAPPPILIY